MMFPLPKSGSVGLEESRGTLRGSPGFCEEDGPMETSHSEDVRGEHER
jgi:hypothetical protein